MRRKGVQLIELLTEEYLEIHKLVYHGDQLFEDRHRPIEHNCRKENEKLECRILIETNIFWNSNIKMKMVMITQM